jgi:hypothetical protein
MGRLGHPAAAGMRFKEQLAPGVLGAPLGGVSGAVQCVSGTSRHEAQQQGTKHSSKARGVSGTPRLVRGQGPTPFPTTPGASQHAWGGCGAFVGLRAGL